MKHTRRSKIIRRSLYVCTMFALLVFAISIWAKPYLYYKSPTNAAGVSSGISIVLLDGVLMNAYWKEQPPQPRAKPSVISGFGSHGALAPAWYMPPIFQPGYIKVPLVYPAAMLLILSTIVYWRNRKKHTPGHCATCNYNLAGLQTTTCPECGSIDA